MPKMKSNRSASKRFKVTGGGKLMRGSAFRRHLLTKKDRSTKRAMRGWHLVSPGDAKRVRRMIPFA
jgi:large subunit ribosomal protein L35